MAEVTHKAKAGATTKTLVYVKNSNTEGSLLGKMDARRLGIIEVHVEGGSEEVQVPWVKQTKKVDRVRGEDIPNEMVAGRVLQAMFSHVLQSLPQDEAIWVRLVKQTKKVDLKDEV